ncbi:MAG: AbrB/MazE/SpoVT family DNA-binding domain-containing protein [Acidimicrobiia bacterium]
MPRTERLYHGFLSFQSRGVLAFPTELRRRLCAETPGAQVEVTEREDGVFEVRPVLPHPADQQWFWTERWQAMEREADADIAAGRVTTFDGAEDFLADLDA